jgi:hypothetical protein
VVRTRARRSCVGWMFSVVVGIIHSQFEQDENLPGYRNTMETNAFILLLTSASLARVSSCGTLSRSVIRQAISRLQHPVLVQIAKAMPRKERHDHRWH